MRGKSPGEDTEQLLAQRRSQLRLVCAGVLALFSLAATWVDRACLRLVGAPVGALNLLLLASTAAGISRQVRMSSLPLGAVGAGGQDGLAGCLGVRGGRMVRGRRCVHACVHVQARPGWGRARCAND